MVYEQGIRFLTDFINGDTYYKIDINNYGELHNLNRARNQFALLQDIEKKASEMEQIVAHLCNTN